MRSTRGSSPDKPKPAPAKRASRAATAARVGAPAPVEPAAAAPDKPALPIAPLPDAVALAVSNAVAAPAAKPTIGTSTADAADAGSSAKQREPVSSTHWTKQVCRLTQDEYMLLTTLKNRSGRNGGKLKRGEVLRLGLAALAELSDAEFRALSQRTSLPLKR